jgi:hypothetical protein
MLTQVPHYFAADYVREYERQAAEDRSAIEQARLLMRVIAGGKAKRDNEWQMSLGIPGPPFAGRGIKPKSEDPQILRDIARGILSMPLWGFSLNEAVARSYGTRFLFRLEGPFHGLAAWKVTAEQSDDAEIIASGIYSVVTENHGDTTLVTLRETGQVPLVKVGGVYQTNTPIPLDRGEVWPFGSCPPGIRVRVLAASFEAHVEALESAEDVTAGQRFFCPAANLDPAGSTPITMSTPKPS